MAKSRGRFQLSLKALLLLPLIVPLGLFWISWQFRYQVAGGTPGFDLLQHELIDGSATEDQFKKWLSANGYKSCERPEYGLQSEGHRDSWFVGRHKKIEHYILVSASDTVLRAEVHFECEKWLFQSSKMSDLETSVTDEAAHKIRAWWEQNASILKTPENHR